MKSSKISTMKLLRFGITHPFSSLKYIKERFYLNENVRHVFDLSLCNRFNNKLNFVEYISGDFCKQELFKNAEFIYILKLKEIKNLYGEFLPSILSMEEAQILYYLVRHFKPKIVVETGVSDGISSLMILTAIKENNFGHLYSVDLPEVGMPRLYGKEPGWIVEDELRENWSLIFGKSSYRLPALLKQLKEIDFFMHDSEHSYKNMKFEFLCAIKHLKKGGIILSDDASSNNSLQESLFINNINQTQIALLKSNETDFAGLQI